MLQALGLWDFEGAGKMGRDIMGSKEDGNCVDILSPDLGW